MNAEIASGIIGLGHAMCDINAELDDDSWKKLEQFLDWKPTDAPHHVDGDKARKIVEFIAKNIKENHLISYNAGGSALNAIRIASWLGYPTAMYGCIGDDVYGNVVRDGLRASAVVDKLSLDTEKNNATGIFCTVRRADSGDVSEQSQKLIIASPSSARRIQEIDLDSIDLSGVHFLHTEGLLADAPRFLEGLIQHCKSAGTSISIDLVSSEFVRRHRDSLIQAIHHGVDIIFCTKREFEALECNPLDMSERLTWIIKADRDGVDCRSEERWFHIDAPQCKIVDDTGAGDAFAGAFLAARIARNAVPRCLEIASASAACALGAKGPRPERACVEALHREFLAD